MALPAGTTTRLPASHNNVEADKEKAKKAAVEAVKAMAKGKGTIIAAAIIAAVYFGVAGLLLFRFGLGDGSDGNWERALVIFNSFSAIGAAAVGVLLGTSVQQVNVANAQKETVNAKVGEADARVEADSAKREAGDAMTEARTARRSEESIAASGRTLRDTAEEAANLLKNFKGLGDRKVAPELLKALGAIEGIDGQNLWAGPGPERVEEQLRKAIADMDYALKQRY